MRSPHLNDNIHKSLIFCNIPYPLNFINIINIVIVLVNYLNTCFFLVKSSLGLERLFLWQEGLISCFNVYLLRISLLLIPLDVISNKTWLRSSTFLVNNNRLEHLFWVIFLYSICIIFSSLLCIIICNS